MPMPLPIWPGNWGPLNDYLADLSTFHVVSNGTVVTAYTAGGGTVVSSTDAGQVLSEILPAANSAGAQIEFRNDGNVFPWKSVPALPKGITNKLLIRLNGATVQLSASGPRFLDFNRVADYDTFQNIEITDAVIDVNNVGGQHHVVLGSYIGGAFQSRINLSNIAIRRVTTINVPVDSTLTNHRLNVYLFTDQAAASEGTQNTITDILVEDCDFRGGNIGIGVGGHCSGSPSGVNILVDRVRYVRCKHSLLTVQTTGWGSGNFHIGSVAKGGACTIRDCYGQYSADVGVEIDAMTDALVEGCVIEDCFQKAYDHTNFQPPVNPNGQRVVFRNCVARRTTATAGKGYQIVLNNATPFGTVRYENCSWYRNTADIPSSVGDAFQATGPITANRIEFIGFQAVIEGINYSAAPAVTGQVMSFAVAGAATHIVMRDMNISVAGQRSGGTPGAVTYDTITLNGANVILDVDGIDWAHNLTTASTNSNRLFRLGNTTTSLRGVIRRMNVVSFSDDTGPRGILVTGTGTLTIPTRLYIVDCDWSQFPVGAAEVLFVASPQNRDKVTFRSNIWRTYPKASAAMGATNFAAATFTTATGNQYIGGDPALIQMTGGSGITAVDVSKDGATYDNVWTQASGALSQTVQFYVDNGDSVKVTFATTQPVTRVLPLR